MSESSIPGFAAVRGFVGRRGWLKKLIAVEVILIVGAFALDAIGTAAQTTVDTSSGSNAETITIFAAMLGAYAILLAVVGSVALLISVVLAARRADHVAGAA